MGPRELPADDVAGPLAVSRLGARLHFALLAALVLVLGHTVALGLGDSGTRGALQATRHGAVWGLAAAAVLVGGIGLAAGFIWRMRGLRRRLISLARSLPRPRRMRGSELIGAWRSLFLAAIVAFVIQENLEHVLAHGHLPGLSVLIGGHYTATVPAFVGVALVVAAAWTVCRHRVAAISNALKAAERRASHAPREIERPADRAPDRRAIDRQRHGHATRRAPPLSVPA